jgi:hypothetical protein
MLVSVWIVQPFMEQGEWRRVYLFGAKRVGREIDYLGLDLIESFQGVSQIRSALPNLSRRVKTGSVQH